MDQQYRHYHEKLMHTNGTTAYQTVLVILPSFFLTFITVLVVSLSTYITKHKKCIFLVEVLFLVVPFILNLTVLSQYIEDVLITLAIITINLLIIIYNIKSSKLNYTEKNYKTNFITNARSTINILSVIAILAVDFNIFPRSFAKTETFGYSLMDTGVGLFVYSNGIVAPETKGCKGSITQSLKGSIPLIIIGGARFISTEQLDYNVPITEYGLHWNFFITLAVVKICSSLILSIIDVNYICISGLFTLIIHEALLQVGLQKFVITDIKRNNFIAANREGIVSSLGYISLYLFSVYFGYILNIKNSEQKVKRVLKLISGSLVTLFLSVILQQYFGISRRLANSSYCFWILFIGIFMTSLFYGGQIIQELICSEKIPTCSYSPLIFDAINYNGLVFFLLGNIMTGIINILFNTLMLNNSISLIILIIYMFINSLVVCLLYEKKIKLKL